MNPTSGQLLQWIVVALLGVAVVMVNSAAMAVEGRDVSLEALMLGRCVVYASIAILAMLVVGRINLKRLYEQRGVSNPVAWMLFGAIVLCVLTLVPGLGRNVNGASRWLYIGPRSMDLSFQPSELAKWIIVLALAWWGARRAGVMHRWKNGLGPALVVLAIVCGIIVIEDLGTAALIAAVGVIMLLAAGARLWQLVIISLPAMAMFGLLIYNSPYRLQRIISFLDPWADPEKSGYHLIQAKIAFVSGGLFGRGLGNGLQKFGYVPEDTTDFLFPIICEELGIAGAVMVVALYAALLWIGLGVVRRCKFTFGRLVGLGVLTTIGLQAIMNIAVVTGCVPTKGIALPLLSYGGTGWILTAAAVGMLVALDRIEQLETSPQTDSVDSNPLSVVSISATSCPND